MAWYNYYEKSLRLAPFSDTTKTCFTGDFNAFSRFFVTVFSSERCWFASRQRQPTCCAAVYNPKTQQITSLNRIDPLQNPQYESASDILKRRMLDRKNKVVGSIRDIVINENGNIAVQPCPSTA